MTLKVVLAEELMLVPVVDLGLVMELALSPAAELALSSVVKVALSPEVEEVEVAFSPAAEEAAFSPAAEEAAFSPVAEVAALNPEAALSPAVEEVAFSPAAEEVALSLEAALSPAAEEVEMVFSPVTEVDLQRMGLSLPLSNSGGHLPQLIGSLVSTVTNERKFLSKQFSFPIGQESRSLTRGILRPCPPPLNTTSCLSLSPSWQVTLITGCKIVRVEGACPEV